MFLSKYHINPMPYSEIRFFCIFICIVLITSAQCCFADQKTKYQDTETIFYTKIPGVTQEEIAAIESIKSKNNFITYGSLLSTEAFVNENGKFSGYTQRMCDLLSALFGIEFRPRIHDWNAILNGLASGTIDFSGDLIPTPERRKKYFMSDAIAERSISIFKKKGSEELLDIAKKHNPKLGFLVNSAHLDAFKDVYTEPFDLVYADSFEAARTMIKQGSIDAFVSENVSDCFFIEDDFIKSHQFFPLIYIPISITTENINLKHFVSVLNKYFAHGGREKLVQLYTESEEEYKKYGLFRSFTHEEKVYIDRIVTSESKIPIVLESDNYPISFFNYKTNTFEGIVPDILADITKLTGLHFTTINKGGTPWDDLLHSLVTGEAAMVSDLMYSQARKGRFLWPDAPFCTTSYAFISKTSFPDLEIHQVMGQKVGVIKGTAYEEMYNKWFPDNKPVVYDTGDMAFEAMERDEITLTLAAESLVLSQTNYREKPGYKVNIALNYSIDAKFGFNINEKLLCSIMDKAQGFVKTDLISKRWFGKVFDYSSELSRTRVYLLLICIALLLVLLAFIAFYFFRNHMMRKKLQELVGERTHELERQICERETAEREARIASIAKSSFLTRMSHEIRTPLHAIIGMSEVAKKSTTDNGKALAAINRVLSSSHHLLGILNDILDMAKIESGKMELARKSFSLGSAFEEVANIISSRCADKHILFKTDINAVRDTVVQGDKLRLNQVLINLLGNAVKFTDSGGCIGLSVQCVQDTPQALQLIFSVFDNGIGMTQEQVARLFVPFEQADSSIAGRFGGTGLGLSISKNLINTMGGDIRVQSALGEGTTFSFDLTLERGEGTATDKCEAVEAVNMTGMRILLAEDIEINRIIANELLSATGAIIDEAVNGAEAVAKFSASPANYYQFIFMDIQMPEMDGYEATRKIRALPRADAKQIPVIAMTANAYREDVEQALASGMNSHLAKPIDIPTLFRTLARYLLDEGTGGSQDDPETTFS